jgi:hypothetical protein
MICYYIWAQNKRVNNFLTCCKEHHVNPEDVRYSWNKLQFMAMEEHKKLITSEELDNAVKNNPIPYDTWLNCGELGKYAWDCKIWFLDYIFLDYDYRIHWFI